MTEDAATRLREAAALIRRLAADATPGPWHRPLNTRTRSSVRAPLPEGERGEWLDGIDPFTGQREHCTVATIPIWSNNKFVRQRGGRDLEWIALMHPGIGEALAAWLERAADVSEDTLHDVHAGYPDDDPDEEPECMDDCGACADESAALYLADQILQGGVR